MHVDAASNETHSSRPQRQWQEKLVLLRQPLHSFVITKMQKWSVALGSLQTEYQGDFAQPRGGVVFGEDRDGACRARLIT